MISASTSHHAQCPLALPCRRTPCRLRPSLLGQSKNGSGKTGAFGLAMLNAVDVSLAQPQALCMSPTLELADQTAKRLAQLASYLPGVTFDTLTSGAAAKYKGGRRVTAQVLVGSP